LARRSVTVTIVVPGRWRHEYTPGTFMPVALPNLADNLVRLPVAFAGKPQRYFHLTRAGRVVRRARPDIAFIEAEPYSLVTAQWALALSTNGTPFGVQCYEVRYSGRPLSWRLGRILPRSWSGLGERVDE
jgi:hypothetical protein